MRPLAALDLDDDALFGPQEVAPELAVGVPLDLPAVAPDLSCLELEREHALQALAFGAATLGSEPLRKGLAACGHFVYPFPRFFVLFLAALLAALDIPPAEIAASTVRRETL